MDFGGRRHGGKWPQHAGGRGIFLAHRSPSTRSRHSDAYCGSSPGALQGNLTGGTRRVLSL